MSATITIADVKRNPSPLLQQLKAGVASVRLWKGKRELCVASPLERYSGPVDFLPVISLDYLRLHAWRFVYAALAGDPTIIEHRDVRFVLCRSPRYADETWDRCVEKWRHMGPAQNLVPEAAAIADIQEKVTAINTRLLLKITELERRVTDLQRFGDQALQLAQAQSALHRSGRRPKGPLALDSAELPRGTPQEK